MTTPGERIEDLARQTAAMDEGKRAAFLAEVCGSDSELRAAVQARVEQLLDDDTAVTSKSGMLWRESETTPERIGPYRILHALGRGGMGQVYLGADEGKVKRLAAIKVVRRGLDTEDVLKRFETEQKILGALDHPSIARFYSAGEMDDGRPYFALEYVKGQPITEYCDGQRLNVMDRLELFRRVCGAVQHMHQNMIVHRDLKPRNILVNEDGDPKILDLGIAKVLNPGLLEGADPTSPLHRLMTPEYASPEQVRGYGVNALSDVYSLGVLLYELLTGHRPYRLTSRMQAEIERVICEVEPTRPSIRVGETEQVESPTGTGTLTITPETVSHSRESRPDRLRRQLAGDLDQIVLMAMRKEMKRRYADVGELSADIARYLEGAPVKACRVTVGYRVRKFVRRNRGPVVAGTAAFLSVSTLAVVSMWQWQRAEGERDAKEVVAVELAAAYESVVACLNEVQASLQSGNKSGVEPHVAFGQAVEQTFGSLFDRLDERSGDHRIGMLSRELAGDVDGPLGGWGDPSDALRHYEAALAACSELDDRQVSHARLLGKAARVKAALGERTSALADYAESLRVYAELAAAGVECRADQAFVHSLRGTLYHRMGDATQRDADYATAVRLREDLVTDGVDDPSLLRELSVSYGKEAGVLARQSDFEGAIATWERILRMRQQILSTHPGSQVAEDDAQRARFFIGYYNLQLDRFEIAEPLLSDFLTYRIRRAYTGFAISELGLAEQAMGELYEKRADYVMALTHQSEACRLLRGAHQADPNPRSARLLAKALLPLALAEASAGRTSEAAEHLAESDKLRADFQIHDDPDVAEDRSSVIAALEQTSPGE